MYTHSGTRHVCGVGKTISSVGKVAAVLYSQSGTGHVCGVGAITTRL